MSEGVVGVGQRAGCVALLSAGLGFWVLTLYLFPGGLARLHVVNGNPTPVVSGTLTTSWGDTLVVPGIAAGQERVLVLDGLAGEGSYSLTVVLGSGDTLQVTQRYVEESHVISETVSGREIRRELLEIG